VESSEKLVKHKYKCYVCKKTFEEEVKQSRKGSNKKGRVVGICRECTSRTLSS
jgi:transposase-like protein